MAVAPLAVLGSAVETLWAWIVSLAVFPCAVAVRSLAVYRPLAVSRVRSSGFGVAGVGFLSASGLSETALA